MWSPSWKFVFGERPRRSRYKDSTWVALIVNHPFVGSRHRIQSRILVGVGSSVVIHESQFMISHIVPLVEEIGLKGDGTTYNHGNICQTYWQWEEFGEKIRRGFRIRDEKVFRDNFDVDGSQWDELNTNQQWLDVIGGDVELDSRMEMGAQMWFAKEPREAKVANQLNTTTKRHSAWYTICGNITLSSLDEKLYCMIGYKTNDISEYTLYSWNTTHTHTQHTLGTPPNARICVAMQT